MQWDIHFFSIPKALNNIRLVFNRTSNSLNNIMWAPSFFLPTLSSLARLVEGFTYQLDLDIGEIFLNFPLPRSDYPYSIINLSKFEDLAVLDKDCYRWIRLWFGFIFSPYGAVRFLAIAIEKLKRTLRILIILSIRIWSG